MQERSHNLCSFPYERPPDVIIDYYDFITSIPGIDGLSFLVKVLITYFSESSYVSRVILTLEPIIHVDAMQRDEPRKSDLPSRNDRITVEVRSFVLISTAKIMIRTYV